MIKKLSRWSAGIAMVSALAAYTAASLLASIASVPPESTPSVAVKSVKGVVNLGVLLPGGYVNRRITIANHTNKAILVTRIVTSCGCTHAVLNNQRILPGEMSMLLIRVRVVPWAGPARITVLLTGNSGGSPWSRELIILYRTRRMLRVVLKGREMRQTDDYIDLGTFPLRACGSVLCTLNLMRGGYPEDWDRLQCHIIPKMMLHPILRRVAQGKWTLTLARDKPRYLGSQSCILRFSFFKHGKKLIHHLSVPVSFRMKGPVDTDPESIFFGILKPGVTAKRIVRLWETTRRSGIAAFRIIKTSHSGHVPLTARVIRDGHAVAVYLHTVNLSGKVGGDVIITVSGDGTIYRFREDYLAYVCKTHRRHNVNVR